MGAKCGLFIGGYPVFTGFVIFVMFDWRGGGIAKCVLCIMLNLSISSGLKKNFLFSGVSTMCLQLGSGANQPVINCHGFLSPVGYIL